jgi:hypothetical protein
LSSTIAGGPDRLVDWLIGTILSVSACGSG